jgi:ATP-binding cassette, subfamily B, bacterial
MNVFIEKQLGQKGRLPAEYQEVSQAYGQIIAYSMADINHELKIIEGWIVLTQTHLLYFEDSNKQAIEVDAIKEIKERRGTSLIEWVVLGKENLRPLMVLRFTKRQERPMEQFRYCLDVIKAGEAPGHGSTADENYEKSLLGPFLEIQDALASEQRQVLFRLLAYLLPYKRFWIVGASGAVCATLLSLVPPFLSGKLVDDIVRPFQAGEMTIEDSSNAALLTIVLLASAYLVREFFMWIRLNRMSILGEWVARDLRRDLYNHMQKLDMDYFSRKQTGSLISRVSSDTDRIWDFIAFGIVEVGIAIITLIFLSVTLISLDWQLGLVMTLPVPILLLSIYLHGERMKKLFLKAWRKWTNVTNVLSDTIPGIQVVKAFGQEEREIARFGDRNNTVTDEFNRIHDNWTRFWPKLMLAIQLTLLMVWLLARPRLLASPEDAHFLSVGTFVAFLLYMTMFSAPIEIIGQTARMLNRALSSAYRIFEVLDTKPTQKKADNPIKLDVLNGEVEFKSVSFSYDGLRPILKKMNFRVKQGEMIGLVGPSGGGKSTLTKLLMRFYDPQEGEILIDGKRLDHLDLTEFRKQVGMVLQDPYLFHGTILENISYGLSTIDRKKVVEAARVANAHDFILKLPYGYDTVVGERGHTLSGGERQRISIARAVLHDPKILILDEATSAVDTETERKIQQALDRLIKGRTVFAIAHRLSTLREADRIFVIKDGQLVEEGTHQKLLSDSKGIYTKLLRLQQEATKEMVVST